MFMLAELETTFAENAKFLPLFAPLLLSMHFNGGEKWENLSCVMKAFSAVKRKRYDLFYLFIFQYRLKEERLSREIALKGERSYRG